MSVGDILDRGLKLLLARLPTLFVITFLVQLPVLAFQVLTPVLAQSNAPGATLLMLGGVFLLALILTPVGTAAILHVISQEFIDRHVGVGPAFEVGLARFGSILLASILSGLVVGVGFMLCIIPGLIFFSWFALFSQVIVVEGLGAIDSLSRSKALSEGYRMRILGVWLLLIIIQALLGGALGVVLEMLFPSFQRVQTSFGVQVQVNTMNQVIHQLLTFPVTALVATFNSVCMTLLYFDLRIRKEGFDLELAAQKQGSAARL
jgi:hypothetical protein